MSRKNRQRARPAAYQSALGASLKNTTQDQAILVKANTASAKPPRSNPRGIPPNESALTRQERYNELVYSLLRPPFKPQPTMAFDEVRLRYGAPLTLGAPASLRESERERLNQTLENVGIFDAVRSSLLEHTAELGQSPASYFMGYATLQNISQNAMMRACVQTVADDITKKWIDITGGDEQDKTKVEKLDRLQKQYHLQHLFNRAAAMVGYFGGAFIFIDTGVPDEDLHLPLAFNQQSAELVPGISLRFVLVDPVNVTPADYNCDNPLRPDYMKPRSWWVLGKKVHSSRLIPLYCNAPPTLLKPSYNFLGIPQAQLLWDYIIHHNKSRITLNNLLEKISLLVFKTDTDSIFAMADGIRQFELKMSAMSRFRNNDSVMTCDKEREDIANVQTSIAGATDIVRQNLELVAAINRTPAVKLLGLSPSGFNATGESDITNYYDHVRSQQEHYRDAIDKCLKAISLVHLEGGIDSSISFEFIELAVDNDAARSMNANTRMQMFSTALNSQVISADEMRQAVKNDPDMRLDFLTGDAPDEESQDMDGDEDMIGGGGMTSMGGMMLPQQTKQASPVQQPNDDASKYTVAEVFS